MGRTQDEDDSVCRRNCNGDSVKMTLCDKGTGYRGHVVRRTLCEEERMSEDVFYQC